MEKIITFIQDVQDAFAHMTNLTMFITDEKGNAITTISDICPFTKLAYEEWGQPFYDFLISFVPLEKQFLLDTSLGLKLIISPIRIKEKSTYYLFAGLILEPSSREYVYELIRNENNHSKELLESFKLMREQSEDKKKESIEKIGKLTNIIEDFLTLQQDNKLSNINSYSFNKSLELIRTGLATSSYFLNELKKRNNKIAFIGQALENGNGQYIINSALGVNSENLIGHTFILGEGFLGHTIAIEQFQFWKDVNNDHRISLYTQKGIQPRSFFCIPIFSNNKLKGVLFGGSTHSELEEAYIYEQVTTYSSLLSILHTTNNLKDNLQNNLIELDTYNEIFRVIISTADIKTVLSLLVDISINLIRGPFACIVYRQTANHSKVDIVSRGLSSTETNDYGYHIAVRAFSGETKASDIKQPNQGKTSWGADVLEFPLMFNHQLYGMLCIGLSQNVDPEKYKSLLTSLSIAGSISILLRENEKDIRTENYTVEFLHNVMGQLDPKKYNLAIRISNLVEIFAISLNDTGINTLKQASLLVIYDFDFIKDYINSIELISILEGCHYVLRRGKVVKRESELIALVYHYFNQNENVDSINELTYVSEELRHQFIFFIKRQFIIESEISLDNVQTIDDNKQRIESSDFYTELNLSPREKEVLNIVLKGYSNKEIASSLFISEHTVKNHLTKIFQKLGVSDRSQAISKVYQMGYTPPI